MCNYLQIWVEQVLWQMTLIKCTDGKSPQLVLPANYTSEPEVMDVSVNTAGSSTIKPATTQLHNQPAHELHIIDATIS